MANKFKIENVNVDNEWKKIAYKLSVYINDTKVYEKDMCSGFTGNETTQKFLNSCQARAENEILAYNTFLNQAQYEAVEGDHAFPA